MVVYKGAELHDMYIYIGYTHPCTCMQVCVPVFPWATTVATWQMTHYNNAVWVVNYVISNINMLVIPLFTPKAGIWLIQGHNSVDVISEIAYLNYGIAFYCFLGVFFAICHWNISLHSAPQHTNVCWHISTSFNCIIPGSGTGFRLFYAMQANARTKADILLIAPLGTNSMKCEYQCKHFLWK